MTSRREHPPGPLRVMAMCTIVLVPALALVGVLALAAAQKRVPRVAVLAPATPTPHLLDDLRQGFREHGWVEGRNVAVEYRSAEGQSDRLDGLAGEIVRADVDLIVALHAPAARAAARATRMIPIVMVSVSSPAESGLIASLARPGRNVTGTTFANPEVAGKRFEILKEVVPKLASLAVLGDSTWPGWPDSWKEVESVARAKAIQLRLLEVRGPAQQSGKVYRSIRP